MNTIYHQLGGRGKSERDQHIQNYNCYEYEKDYLQLLVDLVISNIEKWEKYFSLVFGTLLQVPHRDTNS